MKGITGFLFSTGQGQQADGEEDPLSVVAQLKLEKEREISRLKKQLLQESEERIASTQEALLYKLAKEEEENMRLRNKLTSLGKDLSEVTGERDRLLNEIQVLTDTHRVLEQRMVPLESSISPLSSQIVHEEPILVQESVEGLEVLPGAGFPEGIVRFRCNGCWGLGGGGDSNFRLPVPFNPSSRFFLLAPAPLRFLDLKMLSHCCVIFPVFPSSSSLGNPASKATPSFSTPSSPVLHPPVPLPPQVCLTLSSFVVLAVTPSECLVATKILNCT